MSGRLARALVDIAARRWPAARRDDLRREWLAELHAIEADGTVSPVRYALSLAVRRPEPEPTLAPLDLARLVTRITPAATLVLGVTALLALASTGPAFVAAPLLLAALFVAAGYWRGSRGEEPTQRAAVTQLRLGLLVGIVVGGVFGMVGEGAAPVYLALAWVLPAGWLVRLVSSDRRGRVLLASAIALALAYVSFTLAVLTRFTTSEMPWSYAPVWLPAALAEPVMPVTQPIVANDDIAFRFFDFYELFPHALFALGAYVIAYGVGLRRRRLEWC